MIPNGSITVASRRVLLIENSPSDGTAQELAERRDVETYEAVDIITAVSACQNSSPTWSCCNSGSTPGTATR